MSDVVCRRCGLPAPERYQCVYCHRMVCSGCYVGRISACLGCKQRAVEATARNVAAATDHAYVMIRVEFTDSLEVERYGVAQLATKVLDVLDSHADYVRAHVTELVGGPETPEDCLECDCEWHAEPYCDECEGDCEGRIRDWS